MQTGNAQIKLQCLGGFHLEVDGEAIDNFSTDKARALLVYLAIEAPRRFRRSHLAGMLWSEFTEEQALHNLRQTLVRLRKALPAHANQPPLLCVVQDTLGINPEVDLWVDVNAFQNAYQATLRFSPKEQGSERVDLLSLKQAIELFKGPFLDRFALDGSQLFDEWAVTLRESTNQSASQLMGLLCEYHQRRGDYVPASTLADRIIELTPWDERAYVQTMRLYATRKQWAPAKKRYLQLKSYLSESFCIEPDPSITTLYETIRRLSLVDAALEPSIPPTPHHLPDFSSPFFGRKQEINELVRMLADPNIRCVTLLGMGGIGKTYLSIQTGHLLHGLYLHGTFFISLRPIATMEGFIHGVAETLGLAFSGSLPHAKQLLGSLREKRCLLILDCFEHLLPVPGVREFLVELLGQAAGVELLITSRERLLLQEEYVYPLAGLCSGGDPSAGDPGGETSDALALFMDRARRIDHRYALDDASRLLVHRLCRMVEGHPLSIALMASVSNTRSVADLISELEAGLLAIQSPVFDGSPEQRSLAVVLERSWDSLGAPQQEAVLRLAGFNGSFSEGAALEVAQTSKGVLAALVNKSFLRRAGFTRFDLHEIIRQFTRQKSMEANLYPTALQAHAAYYLAMLDGMTEQHGAIYTEDMLEVVDIDLGNFKDVWHTCIQEGQVQRLMPGMDLLYQFFNIRSRFLEGIDLFQAAYQRTGGSQAGKFAIRIGFLAHRTRQNDLAYEMLGRGLQVFEGGQDPGELGLVSIGWGNFYLRSKDFDLALQHAQKGLACFQVTGDLAGQASAYELLGLIYNRTANFPQAQAMLLLSIDLSRQIQDPRGMISSLNQLGDLACNEGDFAAAEGYFLESLQYSRTFKDRFNQAILLNNLASVYRPQQAYEQEAQVLQESLEICREIGDRDGEAIALNNLAELAVVRGNYPLAKDYCQRALDMALALGEDWTTIVIYDILGEAYLGLQDLEAAHRCFLKAIRMAYHIDAWDLVTRVMVNHAGVYLAQEGRDTAGEILGAALSHPGILFEYQQKAVPLVERLQLELPGSKDEGLFVEVMERVYRLPG